ncbi:Bromodomain transcription factor [Artemisia annua]|uniref:Transcription initiation factor TFIID subunit 8 n=1 Tax=Artemisia annua TaxID=35608 RepID=A0A2U1QAI3_ARTAN|nr:Bromodomain transcription factor [Artemisia annua]
MVAFPDPHTYVHTPVWNERTSDPRADKVELARQKRKAESSLLSLQKRLLNSGSGVGVASTSEAVKESKRVRYAGHYAVKAKYYYTVESTLSFEAVKSMIEEDLKLLLGCYKLTFKRRPIKSMGNVWVKTDRDWHIVVLIYMMVGYIVFLELEDFPSCS